MDNPAANSADENCLARPRPLRMLSSRQVLDIDRMLQEVCPFGEVHLIVRDGKLRYIMKIESRDALIGLK